MASFNQVCAALKSERNYQDKRWGDNLDLVNGLEDYVGYMRNYMTRIDPNASAHDILEGMRKVAAIGVKAMEVFGAPQRNGFPVCGEGPGPGCNEQCPKMNVIQELSSEQLDALCKDAQESTKIEQNRWYRVTETERIYAYDTFAGKQVTYTFHDIRAFCISSSGAHRLIDKYGTVYFVKSGWTVLAVPKAEVV
jgi:hypothetical protein